MAPLLVSLANFHAHVYVVLSVAGSPAATESVENSPEIEWDPSPTLPNPGSSSEPLLQLINWLQGGVVVLAVLGVLYAAGKMALGATGRSDLASEGPTNLIWIMMGVLLMLVAIPVFLALTGSDP